MGIIFKPENEEEVQWRVPQYRAANKDEMDATSKEMLVYTNGFFRISNYVYYRLLPISQPKRVYVRAIIYALRMKTDRQLGKNIDCNWLWMYASSEYKRTRRAILKMWSERPFETDRKDFEDHFNLVMNQWKCDYWKSFQLACREMMAYQFWLIIKRNRNYRVEFKFKLTEYGKSIVRLHRDQHFIF